MQMGSSEPADTVLIGLGDELPFELRLAEAIAWCEARLAIHDIKNGFRSQELQPRVLETSRVATVQGLVSYRATILRRKVHPIATMRVLAEGQLLVYWPDLELACGAAEFATQGFFDVHNVPPWDTWVALFHDGDRGVGSDYLVSWVPTSFVEVAARGIDVNPEGCIAWLSDSATHAAEVLRAKELID